MPYAYDGNDNPITGDALLRSLEIGKVRAHRQRREAREAHNTEVDTAVACVFGWALSMSEAETQAEFVEAMDQHQRYTGILAELAKQGPGGS